MAAFARQRCNSGWKLGKHLESVPAAAVDGSLGKAFEKLVPGPKSDVMRLLVAATMDGVLEVPLRGKNAECLRHPSVVLVRLPLMEVSAWH